MRRIERTWRRATRLKSLSLYQEGSHFYTFCAPSVRRLRSQMREASFCGDNDWEPLSPQRYKPLIRDCAAAKTFSFPLPRRRDALPFSSLLVRPPPFLPSEGGRGGGREELAWLALPPDVHVQCSPATQTEKDEKNFFAALPSGKTLEKPDTYRPTIF